MLLYICLVFYLPESMLPLLDCIFLKFRDFHFLALSYRKMLHKCILNAEKCLSSQSYGLSSSHVWKGELDHKKSWVLKNQCFWTVVLEKSLESPLECKEIKPVNPKGNQTWIFTGSTDAEAETPILWPPERRTDSLEKTLMLGKIEDRRRRGQKRMR